MEHAPRKRPRFLSIYSVGAFAALAALGYAGLKRHNDYVGTLNYEINFPKPAPGWKSLPRTPQSLFLYGNKSNGFLLRGAATQIISDVNPTPELTTDALADYYIDCTHENFKGWRAKKLAAIHGQDSTFSLIEREGIGKTILTAFVAKGNTTFMVTLSAHAQDPSTLSNGLATLEDFVGRVSLVEKDMGGGKAAAID